MRNGFLPPRPVVADFQSWPLQAKVFVLAVALIGIVALGILATG
jgi:hypothetical protein